MLLLENGTGTQLDYPENAVDIGEETWTLENSSRLPRPDHALRLIFSIRLSAIMPASFLGADGIHRLDREL